MKILITGARGQLAQSFLNSQYTSQHTLIEYSKEFLDISNYREVWNTITAVQPDVVINCAAYNDVDGAETDRTKAALANSIGPTNLAIICDELHILLVHYSSDYVFYGRQDNKKYHESDDTYPVNFYGRTKLMGEISIKNICSNYLIFRLSWVYGKGSQNFLYKLVQWSINKSTLHIVDDSVSIPTYTDDIVRYTMIAIDKKLKGVYHLTNSGYASRYEEALFFVQRDNLLVKIVPIKSKDIKTIAKRPLGWTVLSNAKLSIALGITIPSWQDAMVRYIKECQC